MEPSKISKTLLKVAIGFGAFSVIGIVALTIAAVVWFRSITSPAHVKSVAETFMTIADPLPKGFRYTAAYEVSGLPIVQIEDAGTQALYTFSSTADRLKKQDQKSADFITDEDRVAALKGTLAVANKGRLTSKVIGQLSCANEIMCYSIGHTDVLGPDLTVNNGFGGISQSSKTGRYLYLWVQKQSLLQKSGTAIDLTRIKELLSAIKSF
ncbi:hypothetical protein KA344_16935 [bacterium]|nr:hypothetical protein [bacterium]